MPLPIPAYRFKKGFTINMTYGIFTTIVILLYTIPVLIYYKIMKNINIFHCRSYPASISVLFIKLIFPKVSFIFDPRSDFPEENAFKNNWKSTSLSFKLWKYLERLFCKHADEVVAIGEKFEDHIKKINNVANTVVIYNNVLTNDFVFKEEFRNSYREKKKIKDAIIFCYSGSLYKNSWNNPDLYARFLSKFQTVLDFPTSYLFLTPEYCTEQLIGSLKEHNVNLELCLFESPGFSDVPNYLSIADIAMYFLPYYSPRVGTKFVEYCSVGLPTIVNENVCGAAELIDKHKLGISLSNESVMSMNLDENGDEIKLIKEIIKERESYRKRCREFSKIYFDTAKTANKYISIYKKYSRS